MKFFYKIPLEILRPFLFTGAFLNLANYQCNFNNFFTPNRNEINFDIFDPFSYIHIRKKSTYCDIYS